MKLFSPLLKGEVSLVVHSRWKDSLEIMAGQGGRKRRHSARALSRMSDWSPENLENLGHHDHRVGWEIELQPVHDNGNEVYS